MCDPGTGGLLACFDQCLQRRSETAWPERDRAIAAFEMAKTEYAELGVDPVAATMPDLTQRFRLSTLDSALLMAAVAAELDPTFHLLCGLLSGDDRPARPTVALVLEMAGESLQSGPGRQRFGPGAPLSRHSLITVFGDGPLLSRRVRADDRLVAQLLGDSTVDHHLRPLLIRPAAQEITGTADLVGLLEAGEQLIWMHSPVGAAGVSLAAAACARLEVRALTADLHRLDGGTPGPGRSEVTTAVSGLLMEATLQAAVLILIGAERVTHTLPLLNGAAVPVVLISTAPWDPRWSTILPPMLLAPRASRSERSVGWQRWLGDEPVDADLLALRLTPEDIDLVAWRAQADAHAARGSVSAPPGSGRRCGGSVSTAVPNPPRRPRGISARLGYRIWCSPTRPAVRCSDCSTGFVTAMRCWPAARSTAQARAPGSVRCSPVAPGPGKRWPPP